MPSEGVGRVLGREMKVPGLEERSQADGLNYTCHIGNGTSEPVS